MKKTFFIFLMSTLFFVGCSIKKKDENDLSKENLNGRVKELREQSYSAVEKFGKIQKGKIQRKYNYSGQVDIYSSVLIFNLDGNRLELNGYEDNGGLSFKETFNYGDKRNLLDNSFYNKEGGLIRKYLYKYDDKGNQIEMTKYNPDGSLNYKETFKYDDKNNNKEMFRFAGEEDFEDKYIFDYDDLGRVIEMSNYDDLGSLVFTWYYKYNDKGYLIEDSSLHIDFAELNRKMIYKYDDKGNQIEMIRYNPDGGLDYKNTFKYEYDDSGNWIRRIDFENLVPVEVTEREISYY